MREEGLFESRLLGVPFSLKIRLVLILARATANNDVMLQKGIRIFSSRAYALVYRGSRAWVSWQ